MAQKWRDFEVMTPTIKVVGDLPEKLQATSCQSLLVNLLVHSLYIQY